MKWSEFMVCLQRSKCFLCAASCPMRLAYDRLVRLLRELFRANRIEAILFGRLQRTRDQTIPRARSLAPRDGKTLEPTNGGVFSLLAVAD